MPRINAHEFGSITVERICFKSDVLIQPDGVTQARDGSHLITKRDLYDMLLYEPDVVVIGTGRSGNLKIEKEVLLTARKEGVKIICDKTPDAIKKFNKHAGSKKVVAIMHVTC